MISIVIPTLNEEKYIGNLLNSLRNQDVKFEVIIVDSSDNDLTKKATEFYDMNLKYFKVDEKNVSYQRNYGIKNSLGEIIVCIDADCVLQKKCLKKVYKLFNQKKYVAGTCDIVTGRKIFDFLMNGTVRGFNLIGLGSGRGAFMVFQKKGLMFNENIKIGEDVDFFQRIKKKGKIKYFNFKVTTSDRRLKKEGHLNQIKVWVSNAFYVALFGRSYGKLETIR